MSYLVSKFTMMPLLWKGDLDADAAQRMLSYNTADVRDLHQLTTIR
jgi:hypothetical protein